MKNFNCCFVSDSEGKNIYFQILCETIISSSISRDNPPDLASHGPHWAVDRTRLPESLAASTEELAGDQASRVVWDLPGFQQPCGTFPF